MAELTTEQQKQLDDFFAKHDSLTLAYGSKEAALERKRGIETSLKERLDKNPASFDGSMRLLEETVCGIEDYQLRYANALRHLESSRLADRQAHKADTEKLAQQDTDLIPFEYVVQGKSDVGYKGYNTKHAMLNPFHGEERWNSYRHGFGDARKENYASAMWGGADDVVNRIQIDQRDIIFPSGPVSRNQRRLFHIAAADARGHLESHKARLDNFVEGKTDMAPSELEKIYHNSGGHERKALGNVIGAVKSGIEYALSGAGKGMWSKSDPNNNRQLKKYLKRRNEVISSLARELAAANGGDPEAAAKKAREILEGSDDMLDHAAFKQLMDLIEKQLKEDKSKRAADVKSFNEAIQRLNDAAMTKAKDDTKKEDDMWKLRLLQMFLMVSPFAAMSVFNYLGPIADVLGPMFDGTGTFGQGVGEVMSNNTLNPFDDIAEFLKLDEAFCFEASAVNPVEILHIDEAATFLLDNTPVVDGISNLIDSIFSSAVFQDLSGSVGGITTSPLIPIAIAGIFSFFRLDREVDHRYADKRMDGTKGVIPFKEEMEKKLQKARDDFYNKKSENSDDRAMKYAQKEEKIYNDAYLKLSMIRFLQDFFSSNHANFDNLLKTMGIADEEELKKINEAMKKPEKAAIEDLRELGFLDKAMDSFLWIRHPDNQEEDFSKVHKFNLDSKKDEIKHSRDDLLSRLTYDIAKKRGLVSDETNRITDYEYLARENRAARYREIKDQFSCDSPKITPTSDLGSKPSPSPSGNDAENLLKSLTQGGAIPAA